MPECVFQREHLCTKDLSLLQNLAAILHLSGLPSQEMVLKTSSHSWNILSS